MKSSDYYKQREQQIREEWFKRHVPEFSQSGDFKMLVWRQPATTTYYCRYILFKNTLYISGDIGEAVFTWGQNLEWDWIAGCDLSYFAEKCCASEEGRRFEGWDYRVGEAYVQEMAQQDSHFKFNLERLRDSDDHFDRDKQEWQHFIQVHGHELCDDSETISGLHEAGKVIHIRCQGYLIGIKMAVAAKKAALP